MRNIKSESEAENLQWQEHRTQIPQQSESVSSYVGAHIASASSRLPHANPQNDRDSDARPNIATLSSQRSPSSTVPHLTSPSSLTSSKRPFGFQQPNDSSEGDGNGMPEPDIAQKPTIHQDHQLLSFFRLPDRHTLFDLHGQEHTFDLSLHLQGMFFLAETSIPTMGGKPPYQQPELTCYRRNLFSVAGSVSVPRGTLSVITDHGERASIVSQELSISATESVDGNAVRLIVIPWKTPPPNMPQLPAKQDQEPPSFPLIPFEGSDVATGGENMIHPIAWRRLQFRIATANNGRRKELQQHFVLRAKVIASLSNGSRVTICEASTAPIVVRGRSPRNFQSKKETPLSSKSTASTPIESQPVSLPRDLPNVKSTSMQAAVVPQSSFQFDTSHLPPFSNWPSMSQQFEQTSTISKSSNTRSRGSFNILHSSQSSPEIRRHTSSVGEGSNHFLPSPPIAPLAIGNYPDTNPRPTKSPRHIHSPEHVPQMYHSYREQQEVSFHEHLTDEPEAYDRDYFVGSSHPEPWVSTGQVSAISAAPQPQFQYPPDMYIKNEQSHPAAQFPWSNA